MSGILRLVVAAGTFAALPLAPAPLHAQSSQPAASVAAPDSLAFPRQFVKWVLSAQGDSAWAHSGPQLRESMKSAAEINGMALRIATRFGELQATDAELQFDEGTLKVYIAAMRFSLAPEPGAFVVVYSPATQIVERSAFTSLSNVKTRYPTAKLP